MSGLDPAYIGFEEYSEHIPANIPVAVQQATSRFVHTRAARVAELPQWEQMRQIGSDIRMHTLENLDVYLTRLETAVHAAGGRRDSAGTPHKPCRIVLLISHQP